MIFSLTLMHFTIPLSLFLYKLVGAFVLLKIIISLLYETYCKYCDTFDKLKYELYLI